MREPSIKYYVYADRGTGFKLANGNLETLEDAQAEMNRIGERFPVKLFSQETVEIGGKAPSPKNDILRGILDDLVTAGATALKDAIRRA